MSTPDINEPIALSDWIVGTLTVHFAGKSVDHRMTLSDAHVFTEMLDDKRASDRMD